jgi:hypothetical protein
MDSLMNLFADPLDQTLMKYRGRVQLGPRGPRSAPALNKEALIADLERARQRNTRRFALLTAIFVAGFALVVAYAFFHPNEVKPAWLLSGSGVWSGGLGVFILQINKSWWRTDLLLTTAKYASPDMLDTIIRELLRSETTSDSKKGRSVM